MPNTVKDDTGGYSAQDMDEVQEDLPDTVASCDADIIADELPWSEKDLKGLCSIHTALTAELCNDGEAVPGCGVQSPIALQL